MGGGGKEASGNRGGSRELGTVRPGDRELRSVVRDREAGKRDREP